MACSLCAQLDNVLISDGQHCVFKHNGGHKSPLVFVQVFVVSLLHLVFEVAKQVVRCWLWCKICGAKWMALCHSAAHFRGEKVAGKVPLVEK